MRELYTITINDELCYIIFKALELVQKKSEYYTIGKEEMINLNKEQFRNLGNGKVPEVNQVNMHNPIITIDCIKREKIQ